jgi:hypothetical protein
VERETLAPPQLRKGNTVATYLAIIHVCGDLFYLIAAILAFLQAFCARGKRK